MLNRFIDMLPDHDETSIIIEFMAWVRENGWAE